MAGSELYEGALAGVEPVGTTHERSLRAADGRDRTYRLYVPASVPPKPVPLLVALHGGYGSGARFEVASGFSELAEANGCLVAYPDGIGIGPRAARMRTWNGGRCCGPAVREGVDDVGFVAALIDEVAAELPVDPARTFAAGHSNGGILAYRLACELSDRIAAIGVQAASIGIDGCRPAHPVSVIDVHGSADLHHPIDGGRGPASRVQAPYGSVREACALFAGIDGCGSPGTRVDARNSDLLVTRWPNPGGAEVCLVEVTGASHTWMGRPTARPGGDRVGGPPYLGFDTSRAIWAFLSAHPRAA
jgi:polyhydroxybutyrate depolymerase